MITYKNGIIKYIPNDFIVTEKVIPLFKKGNKYSFFILKKNNTSLFNCLMRLSKILKIPISHFHFFGEKDKYALTKQLIYTPTLKFIKPEITTENFSLLYLFNTEDLEKNPLLGNKFLITVRKINNPEIIEERIEKLKNQQIKLPNYYDIQRFGKRYINHIIGYYLLNSKYFEATYLFLCAYSKNENHKVKKARTKIKELFENQILNIDKVLQIKLPQYMDVEKIFLKILSKTRNYKKAWKEFPYKFTLLFKEAYLSYKFNQELVNLIKTSNVPYITKEYNLTIPEEFSDYLKKFDTKIVLLYPLENINITEEKNKKRNIFSSPIIYNYHFDKDEIFENYYKLIIEFFLPKGEFATNLLNFLLL